MDRLSAELFLDIRVSFSLLDEDDINEGLRRLAEVVRSCQT